MKNSDEEENKLANLLKSLKGPSAPTNILREMNRQSPINNLARGLASLRLPPSSPENKLRTLVDLLPSLPSLNTLARELNNNTNENSLASLVRSMESSNKMAYKGTKRRVFISHYKEDKTEVEAFINDFCNKQNVFTPYVLGANDNYDFIESDKPDYIMSKIREKYLKDSTVTIVLIGSCTHSRRFVDWEIKSSLRQGTNYTPNGLIGIVLPSQGTSAYLPLRFEENWVSGHKNCYARYWAYPDSAQTLSGWIDDAYNARTSRANLVVNSQDMMKYNSKCKICQVTH